MTPGAEIDLGPHWWKASALTTRPTLTLSPESNTLPDGGTRLFAVKKLIYVTFSNYRSSKISLSPAWWSFTKRWVHKYRTRKDGPEAGNDLSTKLKSFIERTENIRISWPVLWIFIYTLAKGLHHLQWTSLFQFRLRHTFKRFSP